MFTRPQARTFSITARQFFAHHAVGSRTRVNRALSALFVLLILAIAATGCAAPTTVPQSAPSGAEAVAAIELQGAGEDKALDEQAVTAAEPVLPAVQDVNVGTPVVENALITDAEQKMSALERVRKGVVLIQAVGTKAKADGTAALSRWAGSGVVIGADGLAVTNNHVVTGAGVIKVMLDGEIQPRAARVLGVSECADLAVIKIDGDGFTTLDWYNDEIWEGLEVYAAGFPRSIQDPKYTLTRGIISKNRAQGQRSWSSQDYVLEHDAKINGGSSGGALVTLDGQIVGINYSSNVETDQNFAIPGATARRLVEELRTGEDVNSIGIDGKAFVAKDISAIFVASVTTASPADKAGIRPGDYIMKLEGLPMASDGSMRDYCDVLSTHSPDEALSVQVYRPGTKELLEGQINGKGLTQVARPGESGSAGGTRSAGGAATRQAPTGADNQSGFSVLANKSGSLSFQTPKAWADRLGDSWKDKDGGKVGVYLRASTDHKQFPSRQVPGIFVAVTQSLATKYTPDTYLDAITKEKDCTYIKRTPYQGDGRLSGQVDLYAECGAERTMTFKLVLTPPDKSYLVFIVAVAPQTDDAGVIDHILQSIEVDPSKL